MSDLWDWVTAVWLGACACGALAAAKVGFVQHDLLLLAVSTAAAICLAWLIGGHAASRVWRRLPAAAGLVADGNRDGGQPMNTYARRRPESLVVQSASTLWQQSDRPHPAFTSVADAAVLEREERAAAVYAVAAERCAETVIAAAGRR